MLGLDLSTTNLGEGEGEGGGKGLQRSEQVRKIMSGGIIPGRRQIRTSVLGL